MENFDILNDDEVFIQLPEWLVEEKTDGVQYLEPWYQGPRKRYPRQCSMTKSNDERYG